MSDIKDSEFTPLEVEDYIPSVVKRLLKRIESAKFAQIALYGFSDNMKWLYTLLRKRKIDPVLCDWREEFISYDCGGKDLVSVDSVGDDPDKLLVICVEESHAMKNSIRYLIENNISKIPVIYDRAEDYLPFQQEQPYKGIAERARSRAISMISDEQLFDLIQFIDMTKDIEGDVVEYGSLHGGSGAIISEAVKYFGDKPVWLFDSFAGIPKSKYGLDHFWDGSFSNNSYSEVKAAFKDMENVNVINGNICETYDSLKNNISFGYLASDTLETGELLLNYMWPKLSPGGIIAICDYGSYPNCVPLTVITDMFFEDKSDAFIFKHTRIGIFIMKREK